MRNTWDPTVPAMLVAAAMLVGSVAATGGLSPGDWRGKLEWGGDRIHLDIRPVIRNGEMRMSFQVKTAELEGFDAAAFERRGAPLRLVWRRPAGAFLLDGEGGRRPRGTMRFEPDPKFVEGWRALAVEPPSEDDFVRMALHDVRLADVERLHELGYRDVNARSMIRLSGRDGMMEWIEGMQAMDPKPSLDDLFRLQAHGIDAEFVRSFAEHALSGVGAEDLLRLQRHGIDAGYLRGMIDAGIAVGDIDAVIRLNSRGISPDYLARLRAAGLPVLAIDEQIRIHDQGIEPDYAREIVGSGLPGLSIDDLLRLHSHGVRSDFTKALVVAGPGKRGAKAVIFLHDRGVSEDWIREMAELGYGDVEPNELARLHSHGVSPDLIRSLSESGHRNVPVDDVIRAATHGPESLGPVNPGPGESRPSR